MVVLLSSPKNLLYPKLFFVHFHKTQNQYVKGPLKTHGLSLIPWPYVFHSFSMKVGYEAKIILGALNEHIFGKGTLLAYQVTDYSSQDGACGPDTTENRIQNER